jgi:hypothetical protein
MGTTYLERVVDHRAKLAACSTSLLAAIDYFVANPDSRSGLAELDRLAERASELALYIKMHAHGVK